MKDFEDMEKIATEHPELAARIRAVMMAENNAGPSISRLKSTAMGPFEAGTGPERHIQPQNRVGTVKPHRANKYNVAPKEERIYNGVLYASKKESLQAADLDLQVKAGEIDFWLRQVPIRLPGGKIYKVDFVTFKAGYWDSSTLPIYKINK